MAAWAGFVNRRPVSNVTEPLLWWHKAKNIEVLDMARKLKTFQTTLGFFELAVAAPSMKAALEAWGSTNNLFQMGFAAESEDAAVIKATMAKPGVVLRRAVGSTGKFSEHAKLPESLPDVSTGPKSKKLQKPATRTKSDRKPDDSRDRRAALAVERRQRRREQERRKQENRQLKARARQELAIARAREALAQAADEHRNRIESFEDQRAKLDRQTDAEEQRWDKQRQQLEARLRRIQDS
jgi:colicin import membrane protein